LGLSGEMREIGAIARMTPVNIWSLKMLLAGDEKCLQKENFCK